MEKKIIGYKLKDTDSQKYEEVCGNIADLLTDLLQGNELIPEEIFCARLLCLNKCPDENGKLVYYDQTPIKEQQSSFKKNSQEALSATGKFEFLKNYPVEERALFISKLVPKTSYTEKKYNQITDSYDIVHKQ